MEGPGIWGTSGWGRGAGWSSAEVLNAHRRGHGGAIQRRAGLEELDFCCTEDQSLRAHVIHGQHCTVPPTEAFIHSAYDLKIFGRKKYGQRAPRGC